MASWRADGYPLYAVSPPGHRADYCLVNQFDESNLVSSIPLVGPDMCSFKTLLPVLQAATDTGTEQAVAESALVPGPAYAGNFLLVAAVFSGAPTTVAQRQAQRVGWVATLVNGSQMLRVALGPDQARHGVELFSGSEASPKHLIGSSPAGITSGPHGAVTEHLVDGGTWTLLVRPLAGAPGVTNPLVGPAVVFVTSMLLNLALAGLVWELGRGRLRARRSFMQSEQRFQSMASSSPVGILELNQGGMAQYFNRRLQEIAGVGEEDLREGNWLDCVHPDDRASGARARLGRRGTPKRTWG